MSISLLMWFVLCFVFCAYINITELWHCRVKTFEIALIMCLRERVRQRVELSRVEPFHFPNG